MRHPTGEQFELVLGTAAGVERMVVTELAAGLREFQLDGVDLIEPFPAESEQPSSAGITLVPWPNRVRDGRWTLPDGTPQQLVITEPPRNTALHGLLRWTPYRVVSRGEATITLAATVYPQLGWPFLLDVTVTYTLVESGFEVVYTAVNAGTDAAPVAFGAHPYFRIGDAPKPDLLVTVHAATHYDVDERLNPVREVPVDGTPFDLRSPHRLGELTLDDGFGQAGPGALAALAAPDGRTIELWGDESFRWVQAYTGREFPTLPKGDIAVALEPMSAPADALNSGEGLVWLEPGETCSMRWGIRLSGF